MQIIPHHELRLQVHEKKTKTVVMGAQMEQEGLIINNSPKQNLMKSTIKQSSSMVTTSINSSASLQKKVCATKINSSYVAKRLSGIQPRRKLQGELWTFLRFRFKSWEFREDINQAIARQSTQQYEIGLSQLPL